MAVRTPVKFYYDILSPFSWVAFESLCRYQKAWNLDLQLKPMDLNEVVSLSGNKPPGMIRSKGLLLLRDIQRLADMMDLPYKRLADFEQTVYKRGSIPTLTTLAACQIMFPKHLEELSRQAWLGLHSRDIDITDQKNIKQFAEAAQIPDIDKLIEFSLSEEARQQLNDNMIEALDSKCFGAPWFTVTNPNTGKREKFFGSDRIEMLGWVLGKEYMGLQPPQ